MESKHTPTLLYFAYGSNLNWEQFKSRCPSARYVCRAVLPGHRVCFPRNGDLREGGVASVEQAQGSHVWGVVYEISLEDIAPLDEYEGHMPGRTPNEYERSEIAVLREGEDALPMVVMTYFANPEPEPMLPSRYYMDVILKGARHWKLPPDYVRILDAFEVRPDV